MAGSEQYRPTYAIAHRFILVKDGSDWTDAEEKLTSKKINVAALLPVIGTMYPPPYHEPCLARSRTKLGDAVGLTQLGVNLLRLPPGA